MKSKTNRQTKNEQQANMKKKYQNETLSPPHSKPCQENSHSSCGAGGALKSHFSRAANHFPQGQCYKAPRLWTMLTVSKVSELGRKYHWGMELGGVMWALCPGGFSVLVGIWWIGWWLGAWGWVLSCTWHWAGCWSRCLATPSFILWLVFGLFLWSFQGSRKHLKSVRYVC